MANTIVSRDLPLKTSISADRFDGPLTKLGAVIVFTELVTGAASFLLLPVSGIITRSAKPQMARVYA